MNNLLEANIEVNRKMAQVYQCVATDALTAGYIGLACRYQRQAQEANQWREHYERELREEEMTKDLENPEVAKAYGMPVH